MKYALLNGSPRGESSNSLKIGRWITAGLEENEIEPRFLSRIKQQDLIMDEVKKADSFIFVFPLYVDSLPAQVKVFFEKMEQQKQHFQGKQISFVIHSGFPERIHSLSLERYLRFFTSQVMEMNCLGVAIIGGSEALQMAPDQMYTRQIKILTFLIECIKKGESFPADINKKLTRRKKLSIITRILYPVTPMKHFYWRYRARKHPFKVNLKARPYAS